MNIFKSKNIQWVLLFAILGVISCNKSANEPDVIELTNIDDTIRTALRFDTTFIGCIEPVPRDSIAIFSMDANSDGLIDFQFTVNHRMIIDHETCDKMAVDMQLKASQPGFGVSVDDVCLKSLLYTEQVNKQTQWNSSGYIYDSFLICHTLTHHVFGIREVTENKTFYGWVTITFNAKEAQLVIEQLAWNATSNHDFYAGQTE